MYKYVQKCNNFRVTKFKYMYVSNSKMYEKRGFTENVVLSRFQRLQW